MTPKLLAAVIAAAVLPVAAQTATPRADERQAQQEKRIHQADGRVTAKERARLAKSQNKQGRKIEKQKHDRQKKAAAT